MGAIDIAVIVVCTLAVAGVAGAAVYRRIKGKPSGCGGGCAGCPYCSGCSSRHRQKRARGENN